VAIKMTHRISPEAEIHPAAFNSSGPLANSRNGEPFRRRIDRPHRRGDGNQRSTWSRQHEEMGALLGYRL
jgi:hypothetical protein